MTSFLSKVAIDFFVQHEINFSTVYNITIFEKKNGSTQKMLTSAIT